MKNLLQKRINKKYPSEKIKVLFFSTMQEEGIVKCLSCGQVFSLKRSQNFLRKEKTCICKKCFKKNNLLFFQQKFEFKLRQKFPLEKVKIISYHPKGKCQVECLKCKNMIILNEKAFFQKEKKRICPKCHPNKEFQICNSLNKFLFWEKRQSNFIFSPSIEDQIKNTRITSKTLLKSYCKKCGFETQKTIYDYMKGKGCGKCKKNILKTSVDFQKEIGEEYLVLRYKGMNNKALFKHSLCGFIYAANPRGFLCPKCKGSKGERKIRFFCLTNNIVFEEQKTWEINGHLLRTDFFLPDYGLVIEYNGEQHYKPISFFGGEKSFQRQQEYDALKKKFFKDKLLTIPFTEYENIDFILNKYLFKSSSTKRIIYPIKCRLKQNKFALEADTTNN